MQQRAPKNDYSFYNLLSYYIGENLLIINHYIYTHYGWTAILATYHIKDFHRPWQRPILRQEGRRFSAPCQDLRRGLGLGLGFGV